MKFSFNHFLGMVTVVSIMGFTLGKMSETTGSHEVLKEQGGANRKGEQRIGENAVTPPSLNTAVVHDRGDKLEVYIPAIKRFTKEPYKFVVSATGYFSCFDDYGPEYKKTATHKDFLEKSNVRRLTEFLGTSEEEEQKIYDIMVRLSGDLVQIETVHMQVERIAHNHIIVHLDQVNRHALPIIQEAYDEIQAVIGVSRMNYFREISPLKSFQYGNYLKHCNETNRLEFKVKQARTTREGITKAELYFGSGVQSEGSWVKTKDGVLVLSDVAGRWKHMLNENELRIP
jgi:hypothetical protein